MPQYNAYKSEGRTLMLKFTCCRCKKEHIDELEKCVQDDDYGYLHNTKLPEGWRSVGRFGNQLLCDECFPKYVAFLNNEEF